MKNRITNLMSSTFEGLRNKESKYISHIIPKNSSKRVSLKANLIINY